MQGLYIDNLRDVLRLTPRGEIQNRTQISAPGVQISDIGCEVLYEPLGSLRGGRVQRRDRPVQTGTRCPTEFLAHTYI
jgi:hypothetical protein